MTLSSRIMRNEKDTPEVVAIAARQACQAGLNVLPPREDGSKAPAGGKWKASQHVRATESDVEEMYLVPRTGLGIVTGEVSGNVILFEFDDLQTRDNFKVRAVEFGTDALMHRIECGYSERTPGGGEHWLIRVNTVPKSQKLAVRPKADGSSKVLVETKGEGATQSSRRRTGLCTPPGRRTN